jgi:hypothetical protein
MSGTSYRLDQSRKNIIQESNGADWNLSLWPIKIRNPYGMDKSCDLPTPYGYYNKQYIYITYYEYKKWVF